MKSGNGNSKNAKFASSEDEESDSCSDNGSSETGKNKKKRQRKIQQFSVLRSDSDGLRMKISAIRNKKEKPLEQTKSVSNNNNSESTKRELTQVSNKTLKRKLSTASSSSCCSVCTRSESDSSSEEQTKEKPKKVRVKRKKNYTSSASDNKFAKFSSDSESGGNPAENKVVLNRITAKRDNTGSNTTKAGDIITEVLPGSCISSSDTELPALVNAAIKCVESCSESENSSVQPRLQYTSSLLHDFMVKTQMLGNSEKEKTKLKSSVDDVSLHKTDTLIKTVDEKNETKKKRGRPKKKSVIEAIAAITVHESGDSGITSTIQSSSPSPNNNNSKRNKNNAGEHSNQNGFAELKDAAAQKINIVSLDKQMYATERVLYPPRSKKRTVPKTTIRIKSLKDDIIDPLWRKIDVNTKFRRPSLTGYKSDGGNTICSKILAAKSGYVSDYGSIGSRILSGYKSDVSGKSRYSTRSCISRAKSCDYRCESIGGKSRKIRRKRRFIENQSKQFGNVNEQDILQLAGLSLGQSSEESSRESLSKPITYGQSKKYGEINRFVRTGEYFGRNKKSNLLCDLGEICEAISENSSTRSNLFANKALPKTQTPSVKYTEFSNDLDSLRTKIRTRRSSAVSRCSSLSICSRYDVKKRRRKFRTKSQSRSVFIDSKLNTEIEILINTFPSLCRITGEKLQHIKDKEKIDKEKSLTGQKSISKRNQKKRKLSENAEHHISSSIFKRRHKKTSNNCPDDHKLPLKKRHYLLTPGEKTEGKSIHLLEGRAKDATEAKSTGKYLPNANAKLTSKPVTPKKRHLLESSSTPLSEEHLTQLTKGNYSPLSTDLKPSINALETNTEINSLKFNQKNESLIKKKNRLEGFVSKIQNVGNNGKEITETFSEASYTSYPPPGVFEPSVELEIQITLPKQAMAVVTKSEIDSPKNSIDPIDFERSFPEPKSERVVETLLNRTGGSILLKRKRRKTFNRTGFPAMKKRKRKLTSELSHSASESETKNVSMESKLSESINDQELSCDRVPHVGEASSNFLQRNKQPRLSVVSLERLQDPNKKPTSLESSNKEVVDSARIDISDTIKNSKVVIARNRRNFSKRLSVPDPPREEIIDKKENIRNNHTTGKIIKSNNEVNIEKVNVTEAIDNHKQNITTNQKDIKLNISKVAADAKSKANTRSRNKTASLINNTVIRNVNLRLRRAKIDQIQNKDVTTNKVKEIESKSATLSEKATDVKRVSQRKSMRATDTNASSKNLVDKQHPKDISSEKTKSVQQRGKLVSKETNAECNVENLEQEILPTNEGHPYNDEMSETSGPTSKIKKSTKWKKSFLAAGLLSDYYKSDKSLKSIDTVDRHNALTNDHSKCVLPRPPYCEKFFRKSVYDFLLPYDLWWAYTNSKLPSRITVPSWNYKKIRSNMYGDVRPNPVFDHQACNCKPQTACGDDCLNRMVYTECSPANCPCGDKCNNQKIQKHEIAPGIERFMTENKGWGVKTNLPIRKSTYILEYVGEVVTEKEFKERMATLYVNDTHHYCLHLDGGLVIDGHRMGSDGRFVNHSCSPNCEMQKWSVNGLFRMALFALRNIEPGEELTYDYNFSLFNPSEGQPCRCETPQCRGVIGGKSQRIKPLEIKAVEPPSSNRLGRPRKRQARKNTGRFQSKDIIIPQFQIPSDREKKIIRGKHCFLVRNLEKIHKLKIKSKMLSKNLEMPTRPITPSSLAVQISALRVQRNIKTRGLTQAAHDPELEKMAKMAVILRKICSELEGIKDKSGKSLIMKLCPVKKGKRASSERLSKSIDFTTIQTNVEKGYYKDVEMFDQDITKLFTSATSLVGSNTEQALAIEDLKKTYTSKKTKFYDQLAELVAEQSLKNFRCEETKVTTTVKTTEDIIRCICGLFKDEGLMIQCAKCLAWQHAECTKADTKAENYLCERCEPRKVDSEITLDEYTEDGHRYYLSLLRGDLQIRQGDTVYVLRDIPIKDENGKVLATKKHTYETIGKIDYSECDIFRVERLWKNSEGKRLIFGHHYLRPHETFHEPTRKFYTNEVIRVPLYEVVPIELVIARCWVLDRSTFCKGRPIDLTSEQHVYICELRVDKSARFFSKAKQPYPTCTKNYAFKKFKETLKIFRTYAPHDVDPTMLKPKKRKSDDVTTTKKAVCPIIQLVPPPPKTLNEKRTRLEGILSALKLNQKTEVSAAPLDLSYLLTGRGARQRRATTAVVPI